MRLSYRWVIAGLCVLAGGGAAGFVIHSCTVGAPWQLNSGFAFKLDPSDPEYRTVMCGPASLSIALGRLGFDISPAEVASECKVTSKGVALTDLERVANSNPLMDAHAQRLHWDEVCRLNGVAVLFVKGNHYIAVDPREATQGTSAAATVRVYESERPAASWTREKLERIWTGEAVVITRRAARADEGRDGPCIAWDECFIDQGVLKSNTPVAHYRFSFRNDGNSDLVIGNIKTSCGCVKHKLSQERLAPGGCAVLDVDVDIDGSEGYIHQTAVVETNDTMRPICSLTMAGGVPRARCVSSDIIRLEDVPQGGRVSREFFVADPGFTGVHIREASFAAQGNSNTGERLSCLVSYELVGKEIRTGFRTKPDDYVVRLSFEADKACPLGPFQGEVKVVLEADDVLRTHKVMMEGMIVQDVHPVPPVSLITLDSRGVGSTTIQLHSYSKRDFGVAKVRSGSRNALEIRPAGDSQAANNRYTVTVQNADMVAGAVPLEDIASFELTDGSVVSIPVTVFRPPQ